MKYVSVRWIHNNSEYPVLIHAELDNEGWEVRKIEVHADGSCSFADQNMTSGDTILGIVPYPPLEEINQDPQFQLEFISAEEFNKQWSRIKSR